MIRPWNYVLCISIGNTPGLGLSSLLYNISRQTIYLPLYNNQKQSQPERFDLYAYELNSKFQYQQAIEGSLDGALSLKYWW